jgi:transcription elongation GreA/GreB family factor
VNDRRFLTPEEAGLIEQAAERWLRMRDVEFNAGEYAATVLARSVLRDEQCPRKDVATLDRPILLEVPGEHAPIPITIVRPAHEDLCEGRVSILSELGLACIGQVLGGEVRIPHGVATLVGFVDQCMEDCA